jgi:hypothetical protein
MKLMNGPRSGHSSPGLRTLACVLALSLVPTLSFLTACGQGPNADLNIERLPDVTPSVPAVPTLPPPPYPVQYPDTSYSVYGVRRRSATTMDQDVVVTGYIARIYVPEVCEEGHTCPTPAAPHMWIADSRTETDESHMLMVVGYAENQAQIDEAMELNSRGRYEPPDPESGLLPIPVDFLPGAKVKITGHFARISASGFNVSEGLVEWRSHELLEPGTPPPEPEPTRHR